MPASVTPTEVAPRRGGIPPRLRPWLAPGLSLLAGAAVVLVTVALLGSGGSGGDGGSGTATRPATTTTAKPATALVARPAKAVPVGPRPNSIAYARGRVWVTSHATGTLIGLPADGTGARRTVKLGWTTGSTSVASGFGSLWVTNDVVDQLVRLDAKTLQVRKRIAIAPGAIVKVATGAGAVWVGRRQDPGTPISSVVKISPRTNAVEANLILGEEGVGDVAAGGGFVWVPNRRRDRLTRISASSGSRRSLKIGLGPHYATYGAGFAWITNQGSGTVSQVAPSFSPHFENAVGSAPSGVAVGSGAVWIANRLEDAVVRLDPGTGKAIGEPIPVGRNPYAVTSHGRRAWVTNLGDGTVTRIDLR